jgi:hypothetical protein
LGSYELLKRLGHLPNLFGDQIMYTKLNIYRYDCDNCSATARVEAESPVLPKEWTSQSTGVGVIVDKRPVVVTKDYCYECSRLIRQASKVFNSLGKLIGEAVEGIQEMGYVARLRFPDDGALPRKLKEVDVWQDNGRVTRVEH